MDKRKTFQKMAVSMLTKVFVTFSVEISSVTNLKGQFIRVQKVF